MYKLYLILILILTLTSTLFAQDKILYIDGFKTGSSNINDIASVNLFELEKAVADTNLLITFYGLTDSDEWNATKSVSEVLNAGLRLNRAMAFYKKFQRGLVQVGYEKRRGVKVIITQRPQIIQVTNVTKVTKVTEIHNHYNSEESDLDIGFQIGYWTSNVFEDMNSNLRFDDLYHAPYVSVILSKSKLSILGRYGMFIRPSGHSSVSNEWEGKKFGYIGMIYNLNANLGISFGVHRAWEVVLHTDEWETRQSAINLGVVITFGRFEINPAFIYSHIDNLIPTISEDWKPGFTLSAGFNIF